MPALITETINARGYELVRDAIGGILTLELGNQKTLQGFSEAIKVYAERVSPLQESENLYFNVIWDSAQNSDFTQAGREGKTTYYIDIYTSGINKVDGTPGSTDSAFRLHKFVRMCDYILSSAKYSTLGFTPGLIAGKYVENIATSEPSQLAEGSPAGYQRMARITFSVRIYEDQLLWTGLTWGGSDTTMTLDNTALGYLYSVTVS